MQKMWVGGFSSFTRIDQEWFISPRYVREVRLDIVAVISPYLFSFTPDAQSAAPLLCLTEMLVSSSQLQ